jgi:hypothetical protein
MPSINELFPSKWLKAADIPPAGVTLTVAGLQMEEIEAGKTLPVIHFQGHSKGLVLNKTNGLMIAHLHGEDYSTWGGKALHLVSEPVSFQGKVVDSIRVKPPVAAAQGVPQPTQAPPAPEGAPFNPPDEDCPW